MGRGDNKSSPKARQRKAWRRKKRRLAKKTEAVRALRTGKSK